jgi:hypothetical protein
LVSRIRLFVIAFALLVSAEPIYHTHPLAGGTYDGGLSGSTVCACAAGAQQITTHAPVVVAPVTAVGDVAVAASTSESHRVVLGLPSRAPPAA